jgi:hypothetical protein
MNAADHLRAVVFKRLAGVERAGIAGHALRQDFRVLVDQNGHDA